MKNLFILLTSTLITVIGTSQVSRVDINNINAKVIPSNVLFQTLYSDTSESFEVLKNTGKSTIYSTSMWAAGMRSDSVLCGSFQSYIDSSTPNSFSTGPLSVVAGSGGGIKKDFGPATITPTQIAAWNKVFCITRAEIELFKQWYRCSQDPACDVAISFPGYSIPASIINWPAHGDPTNFQDYYLAPFYDNPSSLIGVYDPASGDYPCIKGDKYCWYIINDQGFDSTVVRMGLEIHVEVYSFDRDSTNPLNTTIFVGKDIINRSSSTYDNFIYSQQTDFDIGCSSDDYIGSMPSINSYYGYNGDSVDNHCSLGRQPYGQNPPAQGVTFLNQKLHKSMYYNNSIGSTGGPTNLIEAYGYMNGKWRDGTQLKYSTTPVNTNHVYPYIAPVGMTPWTEVSMRNVAGDRRMLGATRPFTLSPGGIIEIDLAYTFSRSDSGYLKSVDQLYRDIKAVQAFYNDSINHCQGFLSSVQEISPLHNSISVFPNPSSRTITIKSKRYEDLTAEIIAVDGKIVRGKFNVKPNKEVDISQLTNGIYFVRITNYKSGSSEVLRFMKN